MLAHGQTWLTFQVGPGWNTLQTNIDNRPQQVYRHGTGLYAKLTGGYQFRSGLLIETGPSLLQKSYALIHTDTSLSVLDQYTRNDYVQWELNIGFANTLFKKIGYRAFVGAYRAYWFGGRIKGAFSNIFNTAAPFPQTFSYDQKYEFDSHRDQRWEWGWHYGLELNIPVKDCCSPFIGVRVYESEEDQQNPYQLGLVPRYNHTVALSFGLQTKL
jgi:hypothetical protein